jgi:phosphoglucomutase
VIKFGTSGWRGIIAQDFTFAKLRKAALGTARFLKSKNDNCRIVVGYDTRFLGKMFAEEVCKVMAAEGIKTFLTQRDAPTPVISAYIISNALDGGINITASHNPYNYSGFKFSPSWGGPALPEDTSALEKFINSADDGDIRNVSTIREAMEDNLCNITDPLPDYMALLSRNIDLKGGEKSGIKVFFDAIYGTGRGYLDKVLKDNGIETVTINEKADPYFAGGGPEPSGENLSRLKEMVRNSKGRVIGVSTDGDADRFGIIGSDGEFIEPNKIIAFLADYLVNNRDLPVHAGFARSVATSSLLDIVAK